LFGKTPLKAQNHYLATPMAMLKVYAYNNLGTTG